MKKILFILGFLGLTLATPSFAIDEAAPSLNFFFDSSLSPAIGLSCSSESDCKNKCQNSPACYKPVDTCLNCIGARSPYLNDFFNNVGELTTACFEQGFLSAQAESLFKSVSMVPIFPISPYNPLGLKDFELMLKFMSLCPAGTLEPVAIAFTDSITHTIREIPLIKCGQTIFPIVRMGEDCVRKADQVISYINHEQDKQNLLQSSYQTLIPSSDTLPLKYDVLQFSEYSETQYIGCTEASAPVCQNICNSTLSCAIPLSNTVTANGINAFNRGNFTSCGMERFSTETLVSYLNSADSFSFNSLSLSQTFDLPDFSKDFKDLSVINTILQNFAGVFKSTDKTEDSSFFISNAYQMRIEVKMKSLCDSASSPFIMGHNNKVERVFCRSGKNGYFKILAADGENCIEKIGQLSISNLGAANE
jgi:hypothetical protein